MCLWNIKSVKSSCRNLLLIVFFSEHLNNKANWITACTTNNQLKIAYLARKWIVHNPKTPPTRRWKLYHRHQVSYKWMAQQQQCQSHRRKKTQETTQKIIYGKHPIKYFLFDSITDFFLNPTHLFYTIGKGWRLIDSLKQCKKRVQKFAFVFHVPNVSRTLPQYVIWCDAF